MIEIINRLPNFRKDICQRITSSKSMCSLNKNQFSRISAPFTELMNDGVVSSNLEELKIATDRARDKEFAKIRKLEIQQNGGFILVSGLTCVGTLIVGAIIFMAIKYFVLG